MQALQKQQQQGMVLFVSMMLLLIIAIVVLSAGQGSVLQGRMTLALQESKKSLNASEAAIEAAGTYIEDNVNDNADIDNFTATGSAGLYSLDNGPKDVFAAAWDSGNYLTSQIDNDNAEAQYYIVDLGLMNVEEYNSIVTGDGYNAPKSDMFVRVFKIVARSMGKNGKSERVVMAYYGKRWTNNA